MAVEIMLSTSLVAVPALRRVLPVMNSGPVTTRMGWSTIFKREASGLAEKAPVSAPTSFAYVIAPIA